MFTLILSHYVLVACVVFYYIYFIFLNFVQGIPTYLTCYCMYDIKNPHKRNPSRLEFAKGLRSYEEAQAFLGSVPSINNINFKDPKNILKPYDTLTNSGNINENTIRSLDEIMNMNEVSHDLIELKYPNGKVFYIEDNKDNNPTHKSSGSSHSSNDLNHITENSQQTIEDEKSVIAFLDDVLQDEDDEGVCKSSDYSDILPSVITTSVVVHSSSDSSENDIDELHEDESLRESSTSLNVEMCKKLAAELVNDILDSEEFKQVLYKIENFKEQKCNENESHKNFTMEFTSENFAYDNNSAYKQKYEEDFEEKFEDSLELKKENNIVTIDSINPLLKRAISQDSVLSINSVEDPLHSDVFKNKLNKMIMMRPPSLHQNQKNTIKANKDSESSQEKINSSSLKPSKSETDVRKIVLKALQNDSDLKEEENNQRSNLSNIPKPPKFDPVLYKTINSLSLARKRPGLDKLLKNDEERKTLAIEKPSDEPEVPFKMKLEAILKRGPSHKFQKRPDMEFRRTKQPTNSAVINET